MKTKYLYYGTLAALIFVLFGSVNHLAIALESLEKQGQNAVAWSIAIGTELFMILTALGLTVARNLKGEIKKSIPLLTFILFFFAFINLCGNVYYSFAVQADVRVLEWDDVKNLDKLKIISIFTFSFSLPIMAIAGSILQGIFSKAYEKEKSQPKTKKKSNVESNIDDKRDITKSDITQKDGKDMTTKEADKILNEKKDIPKELVDSIKGKTDKELDKMSNFHNAFNERVESDTIFKRFNEGEFER